MGLFDLFVPKVNAASPASISIDAAESLYPVNTLNSLGGYYFMGNQTATRTEAMGVPALARARNIICTTLGSFEMHTRNIATG